MMTSESDKKLTNKNLIDKKSDNNRECNIYYICIYCGRDINSEIPGIIYRKNVEHNVIDACHENCSIKDRSVNLDKYKWSYKWPF